MEAKGLLVFNGGDAFTTDTRDADRIWLRHLRTKQHKPRVIVLPVAAVEKAQKVAYEATRYFKQMGTYSDYKLITSKLLANTRTEYEILDNVDAVVLTDGSAIDMIERLRGTHAEQALHRVLLRKAVIMGTGASAMAMGSVFWFGHEWLPGLALAPQLAILTHHNLFRMRFTPERLLADLPDGVTLIGIDQATTLIYHPDGTCEVVGRGNVTVYRSTDQLDDYASGTRFTLT